MSDLISKKAAIERAEACAFTDKTIQRQWMDWLKYCLDAPPVNAVPVVRCKNCTRWGTGVAGETEHVRCCEFGRYMVGENGYCVYGELRTSAE